MLPILAPVNVSLNGFLSCVFITTPPVLLTPFSFEMPACVIVGSNETRKSDQTVDENFLTMLFILADFSVTVISHGHSITLDEVTSV